MYQRDNSAHKEPLRLLTILAIPSVVDKLWHAGANS